MASAPLRLRSVRAVTVAAAVATAPLTLTAPVPATAVPAPATAATAAATAVPTPATAAPAPGGTAPGGTAPGPGATAPALAPEAPAAPAVPAPDPSTPACGTPGDTGFPLDTRMHGGPASYAAGGPFQEWELELTNTTEAPCSGIHPVLVLTDRDRVLHPERIRFEFYDAGAARWQPVAFEATDEAENVGVFTDFGGFSVPAGRTLAVPVRLAFGAETAPGEVVVNAAIVQRQGADGDWIGESGDYRLTIGPPAPGTRTAPAGTTAPGDPSVPAAPSVPAVPASPAAPSESAGTTGSAAPAAPATSPVRPAEPSPSSPPATPSPPGRTTAPAPPDRPAAPLPELAHTGSRSEERGRALAPIAVALVLLGAVLFRAGRRRNGRPES
ncbi:hypothetical protein [Streptomyces sp. NPDC001744]|uniref:hypothetical protein n=1 Tax=Streptomyces sp. NPDC001744 TaxID=3364606 RepID=UPI0036B5BD3F